MFSVQQEGYTKIDGVAKSPISFVVGSCEIFNMLDYVHCKNTEEDGATWADLW